MNKNKLSSLSNIPPWLPRIFEKSFKLFFLFINEKNKSPINGVKDKIKDIIKLKFNKINIEKEIRIEPIDPDHVLFGLIEGKINGPLKDFPIINAEVSFKKHIRKII